MAFKISVCQQRDSQLRQVAGIGAPLLSQDILDYHLLSFAEKKNPF